MLAHGAKFQEGILLRLAIIALLLFAPWPNGLNAPVWTGALFAFASALAAWLVFRHGAAIASPRLRPSHALFIAGAAYLTACAWTGLQLLSLWPPPVAHPAWSAIERSAAPMSASPGLSIDAAMLLASYGAIFLYAYWAAEDLRAARQILAGVAAACAGSALLGLLQFAGWDMAWLETPGAAFQGRLSGPFVSPNIFASYLSLGFIILLGFIAFSAGRNAAAARGRFLWLRALDTFFKHHAMLAAGAMIIASALLLTASRGGFIATAVGTAMLAALFAASARPRARHSLTALMTAAALAGFMAASSFRNLGERFAPSSASALSARPEIWRVTTAMIEERPLFGHGAGAFQDAQPAYQKAAFADMAEPFLYAHNVYLETVSDLGVPVAMALFAAVGLMAGHCLLGVFERRSRHRRFPAVAAAATAALGAHGLVDNPFAAPAVALSFAAILGVGCAQSASRRRRAADPSLQHMPDQTRALLARQPQRDG